MVIKVVTVAFVVIVSVALIVLVLDLFNVIEAIYGNCRMEAEGRTCDLLRWQVVK